MGQMFNSGAMMEVCKTKNVRDGLQLAGPACQNKICTHTHTHTNGGGGIQELSTIINSYCLGWNIRKNVLDSSRRIILTL